MFNPGGGGDFCLAVDAGIRIVLMVISTWFQVVPPKFNRGWGCLAGPMQQNICLVDTGIMNSVWSYNSQHGFRWFPQCLAQGVGMSVGQNAAKLLSGSLYWYSRLPLIRGSPHWPNFLVLSEPRCIRSR